MGAGMHVFARIVRPGRGALSMLRVVASSCRLQITHEIFGEVKVSASSESQAKRTPLKELRQVSA